MLASGVREAARFAEARMLPRSDEVAGAHSRDAQGGEQREDDGARDGDVAVRLHRGQQGRGAVGGVDRALLGTRPSRSDDARRRGTCFALPGRAHSRPQPSPPACRSRPS